MRAWLRDDVVRRLLRNLAHLLSGRAVAATLGVVSLAVMARALGPELLGILVMIEAYARLIDQTVRLESWQALIKYGGEVLEDRSDNFRQLIKFGILVDVVGALVAALVALLAVPLAGQWLDWSVETMQMARLYIVAVVFHLASTPVAVLRLFDRFSVLAWLEALAATLKLILVTAAFIGGAGLWTFLLLIMGVQIAQNLVLVALSWQELRRQGYGGFLTSSTRGITRCCPGIWKFIWSANASMLIRKSTQELDVLIVGGLIGPAAVGLYHLAKRLSFAALKYGGLLQQAVYPDLARLWARRDIHRFRRMVLQVSLATGILAGSGVLIVALNADLVVRLIAGTGFEGAVLPLIVQMAAVALALCGITLRPALMSMGLQMEVLKIVIISALCFYTCLLLALPQLGVVAASLAHLVFNAVGLWATLRIFMRGIRSGTVAAT